mmetsp:Transcript_26035/g.58665  ORF Transcript_26035/g.58665 Transcript_26035/m.58665 type:complete len:338 (-) Transcript_26035:195-1208(-)
MSSESDAGEIVVLTLREHADGVWITRLVDRLVDCLARDGRTIRVRSLEDWLGRGRLVSGAGFGGVAGIVNRVSPSDAADPALFKACASLLSSAASSGVPVVNGPASYAVCASKWTQHVLFARAGLASPTTVAFYRDGDPRHRSSADDVAGRARDAGMAGDVLVKPNSGGFGKGIRRIRLDDAGSSPGDFLPAFDDRVMLLQQYESPRALYRVWFLNGRVQCATERTPGGPGDEFAGACAGSCSVAADLPRTCRVPDEVRAEVEGKILPLIPDAFCGSVEFLVRGGDDGDARLYFDLNLLSTLPLRSDNTSGSWDDSYDPWEELAKEIIGFFSASRAR